jgi:hypothetical protein
MILKLTTIIKTPRMGHMTQSYRMGSQVVTYSEWMYVFDHYGHVRYAYIFGKLLTFNTI